MSKILTFLAFTSIVITCNGQSWDICSILADLSADINKDCLAQLKIACNNSDVLWKLFDASSKYPNPGLLYSDNKDFGNFDECLSIEYENYDGSFMGKYCGLSTVVLTPGVQGVPSPFALPVKTPNEFYKKPAVLRNEAELEAFKQAYADANNSTDISFTISLLSSCIPDACSPSEVAEFFIWGKINDAIDLGGGAHFVTFLNRVPCLTKETYTEWEAGDIAFVTFLALVLFLIVVCTAYDCVLYYTKREVKTPVFLAFSLLTNGRKLMHISHTVNSEQIPCLNGMRFISMMWVIAGHGFVAYESLPIINLKEVKATMDAYVIQYVASAPIAVDTFFFLSGFLLAFSYLKSSPKMPPMKQVINIPLMFIHRYLRLTPAIGVLYLVTITILRKLGTGPLWGSVISGLAHDCKKWWWTFLLYVQNYVNYDHICLNHSWYLSADMQMFLLAPIVLIPISIFVARNETTKALIGTGILTVILVIVPMIPRFVDHTIDNVYDTHSRLNDYLIGVMLGVYLRQYKDKPFPFTKLQNLLIWTCVLVVDFGVMLVLYHYIVRNYEHTSDTLFYGLYRPIWCVSLAWMVYSCYKGHGGVINWILTRPIFQVGARLSYCMYLLHAVIEGYWVGITRTKVYWGHYEVFYTWCGHFIVTTILSFIWTLAFESPMITIEKFIFGGAAKKPQPKPVQDAEKVAKEQL